MVSIMAKAVKKVDLKKVAKVNVSKAIANSLTEAGFEVLTNFVDFGFTEGTLVVRDKDTDVQVKFIVPKAGLTRYEVEVEEEDEDATLAQEADLADEVSLEK